MEPSQNPNPTPEPTQPTANPPAQPTSQPAEPGHHKSTVGYILGGIAFIPLIGVVFGVIAIVIGIVKKQRTPILLGLGGIAFSVILYGSLFYFGFVAKTGPFASIKIQLTQTLLNQDKAQIVLYQKEHGQLPPNLSSIANTNSAPTTVDGWGRPMDYAVSTDGKYFILKSYGPDGIANTSDDMTPTN